MVSMKMLILSYTIQLVVTYFFFFFFFFFFNFLYRISVAVRDDKIEKNEQNKFQHHGFLLHNIVCLFVLRFLWSRQPNGVMSSAVSLPIHMFTGQA